MEVPWEQVLGKPTSAWQVISQGRESGTRAFPPTGYEVGIMEHQRGESARRGHWDSVLMSEPSVTRPSVFKRNHDFGL